MRTLTRQQFLYYSALVGISATTCRTTRHPPKSDEHSSGISTETKQFEAFAQEARNVLQKRKIPGVALGIIKDSTLVYANGFGVRNLNTGEPMTAASVMSMASVSKAFTAAAIMQLVETGKVDVDDPYRKYVPYFEMEDARYKDITIRHLLAHRSGMPELTEDIFFSEWDDPWYDNGAAERYVRSLRTGVMLNQNPGGDTFIYSDCGYDILADLIHKVSGELFEDYMERHIFVPLGMNDSTFMVNDVDPQQLVAAHVYDDAGNAVVWENFPYDRKHAPSSCLHSTVEDISRWILAHLHGGELRGRRILQTPNQARLWEMLSPVNWRGMLNAYCWGWESGEFEGMKLVTSIGGQPGVQTAIALLPTEHMAVIVLGNLNGSLGSYKDSYHVFELALWSLGKLLHGEIG